MPMGRHIIAQTARSLTCRSCLGRLSPLARSYHSNAKLPDDVYDVVCVGGGPAGLSLAVALRSNPVTAGLRIALVEAQDLSKSRIPPNHAIDVNFSNRCSSLTPATVRFLRNIGAWHHVDRRRVQPYNGMRVWDGVTGANIHFDPRDHSDRPHPVAFMIENANLTRALLHRLDQFGDVSVFDKTTVADITLVESRPDAIDLGEWPVARLATGQKLWARLLVGADGAQSPVRAFADIASRGWDYDQSGVVATLRREAGFTAQHNETAFQRFLPTGPVALLPLPSGWSSLVWSTTTDSAARLRSLRPEDFVAAVNAAFRLRTVDVDYMMTLPGGQAAELEWRSRHTPMSSDFSVPRIDEVQNGSVASFPLRMRHADSYISERVVLIGDAAHTVHPLAGQGMNLGQGDVESLVGALEFAVDHGQDVGSRLSLERYASERYFYNHAVLGTCDKLQKIFSVESGPVVQIRSLGLKVVDLLTPFKQFLMQRVGGSGSGSSDAYS